MLEIKRMDGIKTEIVARLRRLHQQDMRDMVDAREKDRLPFTWARAATRDNRGGKNPALAFGNLYPYRPLRRKNPPRVRPRAAAGPEEVSLYVGVVQEHIGGVTHTMVAVLQPRGR